MPTCHPTHDRATILDEILDLLASVAFGLFSKTNN